MVALLSLALFLVGVLGLRGRALVGRLVGRLVGMALLGRSLVGILLGMSLVGILEIVVPGLAAGANILAPLGPRAALVMAFLLFSMDVTTLSVPSIEVLLGPTMQSPRFPVEQYPASSESALAMAQSLTLYLVKLSSRTCISVSTRLREKSAIK